MGLWRQSEPGGEVTAGFEAVWIRDQRLDIGRCDRSYARNCCQPPHVLITLRFGDDRSFEFVDLPRQCLDLIGDFGQSEMGGFWQAKFLLVPHDLD